MAACFAARSCGEGVAQTRRTSVDARRAELGRSPAGEEPARGWEPASPALTSPLEPGMLFSMLWSETTSETSPWFSTFRKASTGRQPSRTQRSRQAFSRYRVFQYRYIDRNLRYIADIISIYRFFYISYQPWHRGGLPVPTGNCTGGPAGPTGLPSTQVARLIRGGGKGHN